MAVHGDWSVLFEDWRLLRAQISGKENAYASWSDPTDKPRGVEEGAPAAIQAQDLVLGLCTRQPHQRLTHESIRAHAFMQKLQLPALEAYADELQLWLDNQSLCSL